MLPDKWLATSANLSVTTVKKSGQSQTFKRPNVLILSIPSIRAMQLSIQDLLTPPRPTARAATTSTGSGTNRVPSTMLALEETMRQNNRGLIQLQKGKSKEVEHN